MDWLDKCLLAAIVVMGVAIFRLMRSRASRLRTAVLGRNQGRCLVGMVGHAGHGKDSVGDILTQRYAFNRDWFAKPLKDAARILWLFSEEQLYGKLKEQLDDRWGVSPREAMQFFGTEVARDAFQKLMPAIGERFWLEHFRRRYHDVILRHNRDPYNNSSNVVICDVRFPNEAELIKELGGVLVKIIRPNHNAFVPQNPIVNKVPIVTKVQPTKNDTESMKENADMKSASEEIIIKKAGHKSETSIDAIVPDITIMNDGSLVDLAEKVDRQIIDFLANPPARPKKRKRTPKAD